MIRRAFLPTAAALGCVVYGATAAWSAPEKEDPDTLKARGITLALAKHYEEALPVLRAAFEARADGIVAYNIAQILYSFADRDLKTAKGNSRAQKRALERFTEAYNWLDVSGGFLRTEGDIAAAKELAVLLKEHVALIYVATEPDDATIYVDGKPLGKRHAVAVTPGEHGVRAEKDGYEPNGMTVTAEMKQQTDVRLSLKAIIVDVSVRSSPPGAQLEVEGLAPTGLRTPAVLQLRKGTAKISATLSGYQTATRNIAVAPGIDPVTLELREDPLTLAGLTVKASPPGASVKIDGRSQGPAPVSLSFKPGTAPVNVAVTAPGFQALSRSVPLTARRVTKVDATLAPEPTRRSIIWRWIGYIGGGAVLAAGTTMAVMAKEMHDSFPNDPSTTRYNDVNRLNLAADAALVVGVGALAVTIYRHVRDVRRPPSDAQVDIEPMLGYAR
jgi:hypothetical protein